MDSAHLFLFTSAQTSLLWVQPLHGQNSVILLLVGLWALVTDGTTIETRASELESLDFNYTYTKRGGQTPLRKLLDKSYDAGLILDANGECEDEITIMAKVFGQDPWVISHYNSRKNQVFVGITAKAAAIIKPN